MVLQLSIEAKCFLLRLCCQNCLAKCCMSDCIREFRWMPLVTNTGEKLSGCYDHSAIRCWLYHVIWTPRSSQSPCILQNLWGLFCCQECSITSSLFAGYCLGCCKSLGGSLSWFWKGVTWIGEILWCDIHLFPSSAAPELAARIQEPHGCTPTTFLSTSIKRSCK
jgi:hypothetical protein